MAAPPRRYHTRERRYGYLERVLPLPENVDKISAEFHNGVLSVHLPKTEHGRQIPIHDGTAGEAAPSPAATPTNEPSSTTAQ